MSNTSLVSNCLKYMRQMAQFPFQFITTTVLLLDNCQLVVKLIAKNTNYQYRYTHVLR